MARPNPRGENSTAALPNLAKFSARIRRLRDEALISIGLVIPNYNGARYLEACLRSVEEARERYPYVTCFVADGGSTDGSVDIIRRFERSWLTWRSGPDGGQSAAIQLGFDELRTELVGWLNSDDVIEGDAFSAIAEAAERSPDALLFHGHVDRIDAEGEVIGRTISAPLDADRLRSGRGRTVQPGSFYRRWAVEAVGGVDPSYHLLMDVDLWIRLAAVGPTYLLPQTLAKFRVHADAKSSQKPWRYYRETFRLAWRYERDAPLSALRRRTMQVLGHHIKQVVWHPVRDRLG